MNFVKAFNFSGVEVKEIPNLLGKGAPSYETEGAVGCMYMDEDTGNLYKCISIEEGVCTWVEIGNASTTDSPSLFLYSSLSEAISKVNADDFSNYTKPETQKVAVLRYGPGSYRIDLLDDVSEQVSITISQNVYLSLNGKTLTFNGAGSGLIYSENIYCIIDGKVANSSITLNVDSTGNEYLINSKAKLLQILGGTYKVNANSANVASVIRVYLSRPGFWNDLTPEDRHKWLKDNKNNISNVDLNGCNLQIDGGNTGICVQAQMSYINCKFTSMSGSNVGNSQYIFYGNAIYLDIENCDMHSSSNATVRTDGLYLLKGSIAHCSNLNITIDADSEVQMQESFCLRSSEEDYCEIIHCNLVMNAPKKVSGVICPAGIFVAGVALIKDSTIVVDTKEVQSGPGMYFSSKAKVEISNCNIEGVAGAFEFNSGAYIKISNSTLKGYFNVFKGTDVEALLFKDCSITSGVYTGSHSDTILSTTPTSCGNLTGITYLDSCLIEVADKVSNIFEINGNISMSNCDIQKTGTQKIVMESPSQLNVGVNCNITDDMISGGTASYTNELYRHLEDTEKCSGKDLKVYYDYLIKAVTGQLASIVDGEES